MEHYLNRSRSKAYLATLVAGQLLLLGYQVRRPNSSGIQTIRDWSVEAILPVERLTGHLAGGVGGFFHRYVGLRQAERQNAAMQAQLMRLALQNQHLRESVRELPQLQALLGFQRAYGMRTTAATVIGRGMSSDAQVVYIDRGADAGLKLNMAVITPGGVVGKVSQVLGDSAQVLLVTDPDSGVGALIVAAAPAPTPAPAPAPTAAPNAPAPAAGGTAPVASASSASSATSAFTGSPTGAVNGILRGLGAGRAELHNVLKDESTPDGALVVTSGEDQVFPKGIPIGTVIATRPSTDGVFKTVEVKLAADLGRLENVLVVTGALPPPPDETNSGQTAADIRQARLPALPTGDATGTMPPPARTVAPLSTGTPPAEGDELGH